LNLPKLSFCPVYANSSHMLREERRSGIPPSDKICEMTGAPMGDIFPRIIGEVKCHQRKLVQPPLPDILPAVDDLPIMLKVLFLPGWRHDRHTGVLVCQFPR
jgi:hypothetical protein